MIYYSEKSSNEEHRLQVTKHPDYSKYCRIRERLPLCTQQTIDIGMHPHIEEWLYLVTHFKCGKKHMKFDFYKDNRFHIVFKQNSNKSFNSGYIPNMIKELILKIFPESKTKLNFEGIKTDIPLGSFDSIEKAVSKLKLLVAQLCLNK